MCQVTIDIDVSANPDVIWLDDLTFRFPDGDTFSMVPSPLNTENVFKLCEDCYLNDDTTNMTCGLDTDPRFINITCFDGDGGKMNFYTFKLISDGGEDNETE